MNNKKLYLFSLVENKCYFGAGNNTCFYKFPPIPEAAHFWDFFY